MNRPDTFSSLDVLMDGIENAPIQRSTRKMSATEYERQRKSVLRRHTNASVIGILVLPSESEIALVDRTTGSHQGLAFPSGSVEPGESFLDAYKREMREEAGVVVSNEVTTVVIENRIFENDTEQQEIFVATFLSRLAVGQTIWQTPAATREGLVVTPWPLANPPAHMAFPADSTRFSELALQLVA